MNKPGRLHLAPIAYLCEGMQIEEDIYNYMGNLLLRAGNKLDAALLEKVNDANNRQSYIYISEKMFQLMHKQASEAAQKSEPSPGVTINEKLEQETGYRAVLENSTAVFKGTLYSSAVAIESGPALSLSGEIARLLETLDAKTVFELVNTVATAEEYLRRHSLNVSLLNGLFGRWLALPPAEINELITIGILHDVGKMMVPPEILNAPRALSLFELEIMKMHTEYGERLLGEFPPNIRAGVRFHHEKADGTGYPRGRKGSDIPLASRVTAVSDIYDAMVSSRIYKKPRSPFAALADMANMRGQALDTKLADIFLRKALMGLIGKMALLSNGETAQIEQIDYMDIEHPFVSLHGQTVKSNGELYCVAMCSQ